MTRGDQRERDRAKNLKKNQQDKKGKGSSLPEGITITQKKEMYEIAIGWLVYNIPLTTSLGMPKL